MRHKLMALFNYWTGLKENETHVLTQRVKSDNDNFHYCVKKTFQEGKVIYVVVDVVDKLLNEGFQFTINKHGGGGLRESRFDDYKKDVEFLEHYVNVMIDFTGLSDQFNSPISVIELDSYPPNCNPYRHDLSRMGIPINERWEFMFNTAYDGGMENVRLVNKVTGRVFDLDLYEAEKVKGENK